MSRQVDLRRKKVSARNAAQHRFIPVCELLEDRLAPALVVVPPASLQMTAGTLYSQAFTTSGGNPGDNITFAETGALPVGMSLSPSGQLTGDPGQAQSAAFSIQVTATDHTTGVTSQPLTCNLTVNLGYLPTNLPAATVGSVYPSTVYITPYGGSGFYNFSYSWTSNLGQSGSNTAFGGLSISSGTGQLTGTPTAAGLYNVTVTATDTNTSAPSYGLSATHTFPIHIGLGITATANPLPLLTVNTTYTSANAPVTFQAKGGSGPYSFSDTWTNASTPTKGGVYPTGNGSFDGLSISPTTGQLTGTPTAAGVYTVTVQATNKDNNVVLAGSQYFTLTVVPGSLQLTPGSPSGTFTLPAGNINNAYFQSFFATGGSGDYTFTASAGLTGSGLKLQSVTPPGTVSPTNPDYTVLKGSTPVAGTYSFTVTATDQKTLLNITQSYTLTIGKLTIALAGNPNASVLPPATVGQSYGNVSFIASGGTGAQISGASGTPSWLTFSGGTLSANAKPTQPGVYDITVTATDSGSDTGSYVFPLVVFPAQSPAPTSYGTLTLTPSPGSLPTGTAGNAYSQSITASGGSGSYYYTETGTLPAGMAYQPTTGLLTGTPLATGTFNFTVLATDNVTGAVRSQQYTLTIKPPSTTIALAPVVLPPGRQGLTYDVPFSSTQAPVYQLTASGGNGNYSFSSSGTLPPGIVLAQSGLNDLFVGPETPTTVSSGSAGQTIDKIKNLLVASTAGFPKSGLLVIQTPSGDATISYKNIKKNEFEGCSSKYTYTLTTGGAVYAAAVPTQAGTFPFTVTVNDTAGHTASQSYEVTIEPKLTSFYSVQQIRQAYGLNNVVFSGGVKGDGTGQTVAILETGGNSYFASSTSPSTAVVVPTGSKTNVKTTGTIYVASTAGFPSAGTVLVQVMQGGTPETIVVNYNGLTPASGSNPGSFNHVTTPATSGSLYAGGAVGFNASYLHQFDLAMGIPDPPSFLKLDQYGGTNVPEGSGSVTNTEETEDIEWFHALAPGANIVVIESPYDSNTYSVTPDAIQTALTFPGVSAVSFSYGYGPNAGGSNASNNESHLETQSDYLYLPPAGKNATFVIAAGDNKGAQYPVAGPGYPAPNPYVLSAGMDTLAADAQGNYVGELGSTATHMPTTANYQTGIYNPNFGPSAFEPQPSYQSGIVPTTNNVPSTTVTGVSGNTISVYSTANFPGVGSLYDEANKSVLLYTSVNYQPGTYSFTITGGAVTVGDTLVLTNPATVTSPPSGGTIVVNATGEFPQPGFLYDVTTGAMVQYKTVNYNPGGFSFVGCTITGGTVNSGDSLLSSNSSGNPGQVQRAGPDVVINGEWDSQSASFSSGGLQTVYAANGSSLAAPSWAALIAIANQGRALAGEQPLNGPVGTLPMLYNLPASDFNEITNLFDGSPSVGNTTFNQSGLGSPVANRLIAGLVGAHDSIAGQVTASQPGDLTVYLSSTPGAPLTPDEASTTTDSTGHYNFLVAPGTYYVNVIPAASSGLAVQSSGAVQFNVGADNATVVNFNLVPIMLSPTMLPAATVGGPYSVQLGASGGGRTSFTFKVTAGSLPPGLTLSSSGLLSGMPNSPTGSPFAFTVTATDSSGDSGSQAYSLPVNSPLGNTPQAIYVENLYGLLLQRAADPTASSWVNALTSSTLSAAGVVAGIENSPEYLGDVVAALYEHYLNRVPDVGAQGWVTALQSGSTIEQVAAGIAGSSEFYQDAGGTNAGFLTALYADVLGRAPDSAGYASWLSALNSDTLPTTAALAFLNSTEYRQNLLAGVGWSATSPTANPPSSYFQGYYLTYLLRQGDPAGVAGWLTDLQNGVSDQQVLANILGSAEGYTKWS